MRIACWRTPHGLRQAPAATPGSKRLWNTSHTSENVHWLTQELQSKAAQDFKSSEGECEGEFLNKRQTIISSRVYEPDSRCATVRQGVCSLVFGEWRRQVPWTWQGSHEVLLSPPVAQEMPPDTSALESLPQNMDWGAWHGCRDQPVRGVGRGGQVKGGRSGGRGGSGGGWGVGAGWERRSVRVPKRVCVKVQATQKGRVRYRGTEWASVWAKIFIPVTSFSQTS